MINLHENIDEHLPQIAPEEVSDDQVIEEIWKLKKELKDQVLILGHHYQQDEVIQFADFTGDSLDKIGIFRPATGLWAIKGVTREYFGGAGDVPVTR